MSNEAQNISVKPEDPANTGSPAGETVEQPKTDQPATPGIETPAPDAGATNPPPKPADDLPAAEAAKAEQSLWDGVCKHFSDNWDKYAIGGGALAIGFVLGYAIAKKSDSTESAPAEA